MIAIASLNAITAMAYNSIIEYNYRYYSIIEIQLQLWHITASLNIITDIIASLKYNYSYGI